jgi:predicted porin
MSDRKVFQRALVMLAALGVLSVRCGMTLACDAPDQDLKEQIRVLQQKVEELTRRVDAQEQQAARDAKPAADDGGSSPKQTASNASGPRSLTWNGITLYGTIDVGVAYLSHGAPLSPTYGPGLPFTLQSYSNHPITSLAPNGLSQSRVGVSGVEPLGVWDLEGIFKLETGFNPTSGRLTDGPRSLLDNNGRPNNNKVTASDSSRAGQAFQGAAYAGVSSSSLGTLTFGRQNSLMSDDLLKYDPQVQSQAFSPIGYSGASGGLGDTEDKALDDVLKYSFAYGPARLAVLYQFGSRGFVPEGAESVDLGFDYAGLSVDALYGKVRGAVNATSLTAAQNAVAPGTLAATVSDNTAYAFTASYTFKPIKIYVGLERMQFANPDDPLPNNTVTIGGYVLSAVNNTTYSINRILYYSWAGVRYSVTPQLDVTAAYYHFRQDSYSASRCSTDALSSCAGTFHDASVVADYRWTRRFDAYAGVNYSSASDGLAAGFLYNVAWAPMIGVRFSF